MQVALARKYGPRNVPFTFDVTQRIHLVKFGVNYRLGPIGLFGL